LLAASNLESISKLTFRDNEKRNQFGEVMPNQLFSYMNKAIEDQQRADLRLVVEMYLNLFSTEPALFSKETTKQYSFAPLSSLMSQEILSMKHP